MRRALADEADRIEPADALPEIRARAHAQRRPRARRPWLLTVGAAAIGTAAAIGAFTVFNGDQNTANDGDVAGPGTTTIDRRPESPSAAPQAARPTVPPCRTATSPPTAAKPTASPRTAASRSKSSRARSYRSTGSATGRDRPDRPSAAGGTASVPHLGEGERPAGRSRRSGS